MLEAGDHLHIQTFAQSFHAINVVYTTGYETVPVGKRVGAAINCSYVFVSNPIHDFADWYEQALIWETRRPYLYILTTVEGRLVVGRLDEYTLEVPHSEELVMKRAEYLLNKQKNYFRIIRSKLNLLTLLPLENQSITYLL